jgi:type I site-specific restriction endonuclease
MKIKKIEKQNQILVSGYQLLSTGVNIKKLHNMVLASPLKSYTTVTQSIGRGMRLHESKKEFTVFDLVDDLGFRKPGGTFYKQYLHRKATSYMPEEFPIKEIEFELKNSLG